MHTAYFMSRQSVNSEVVAVLFACHKCSVTRRKVRGMQGERERKHQTS